MAAIKAYFGIKADQGPICQDLSRRTRTERVGAWIDAGGDDHLSPLRASVQATLAVEGDTTHRKTSSPCSDSHPKMTSLWLHRCVHPPSKVWDGRRREFQHLSSSSSSDRSDGGAAPSHQRQRYRIEWEEEFPVAHFKIKSLSALTCWRWFQTLMWLRALACVRDHTVPGKYSANLRRGLLPCAEKHFWCL